MQDFEPSVERVPDAVAPKVRSSALLRVLGSLVGWSLLTAAIGLGGALWGYSSYTASGPLKSDKVIVVPENTERAELTTLLLDQGVVSDPKIFNAALAILETRGKTIRSGEYEFKAGSSMADNLAMLRQGRVLTYKLTIPEGWTSQMALNRIAENEVLVGGTPLLPPEGSLMADTFVFQRAMSRDELVKDMQSAQTKLVDVLWSSRPSDTPLKSKEDMVTLASIVEKETGMAAERPVVAAVFLNRLKQGIRLQSDPTIIYGIVGSKGKLDRPLKRSDIDETTAYNTYRINGLPPGPIASPGRAAMEAVLNPAKVDYLYFVADGTGGHAFATTLDEHNANVKRWRRIEDGENPNTLEAPAAEAPAAANEPAAMVDPTATSVPAVAPPPVAKAPEAKKPEIKNTSTGLENLQLENDGSSEPKKPDAKKPEAKKPETKKPEVKKLEAKKTETKPPATVKAKAVTKPDEKKIEAKPFVKKPVAENVVKAVKKKLPLKKEAPKTN